jgi:hypothetical protein
VIKPILIAQFEPAMPNRRCIHPRPSQLLHGGGYVGTLGWPVERRTETVTGVEDLADKLLDALDAGDVDRARRLLLAGADPFTNLSANGRGIDRLDEPMC